MHAWQPHQLHTSRSTRAHLARVRLQLSSIPLAVPAWATKSKSGCGPIDTPQFNQPILRHHVSICQRLKCCICASNSRGLRLDTHAAAGIVARRAWQAAIDRHKHSGTRPSRLPVDGRFEIRSTLVAERATDRLASGGGGFFLDMFCSRKSRRV